MSEQPMPKPGTRNVTPIARRMFVGILDAQEKKGISMPCWIADKVDGQGYGYIQVDGRQIGLHRHAWVQATGEPAPAGMVIGHVCDVRNCHRNDDAGTYEVRGVLYERHGHLWLGTVAANNADRDDKQRAAIGSRNTQTKLTDDQVREIRASYRKGVRGHGTPSLAKKYGVDQETVWSIVTGRTRRHVR